MRAQPLQCQSSSNKRRLAVSGRQVTSSTIAGIIVMILVQSLLLATTTNAWIGRTAPSFPILRWKLGRAHRITSFIPLHQQLDDSPSDPRSKDDKSPPQPASPQQEEAQEGGGQVQTPKSSYNLGIKKGKPLVPTYQSKKEQEKAEKNSETNANSTGISDDEDDNELHWYAPTTVNQFDDPKQAGAVAAAKAVSKAGKRTRKMVARDEEGRKLRGAIWDEGHFADSDGKQSKKPRPQQPKKQKQEKQKQPSPADAAAGPVLSNYVGGQGQVEPAMFYPDIDLSIPESVFSVENGTDIVWDLMRWEAFQEAQREPLLVSFLHSSILGHPTLESSLAFMLANRLHSPAMISTQIQSLILEALKDDPSIARSLRADMMAVRDRDPACTCLPDVFLYFKGFQALQTYRVAHAIWNNGKHILAHFLQSQMSQIFQIDIHPNATLGSGIMLDHGTGMETY